VNGHHLPKQPKTGKVTASAKASPSFRVYTGAWLARGWLMRVQIRDWERITAETCASCLNRLKPFPFIPCKSKQLNTIIVAVYWMHFALRILVAVEIAGQIDCCLQTAA
jgi:hypothetical protein